MVTEELAPGFRVDACSHDAGWLSPATTCDFVGFGVVRGADGKRFRTRDGGAMLLADLLDRSEERAFAAIAERRAVRDGDRALARRAPASPPRGLRGCHRPQVVR